MVGQAHVNSHYFRFIFSKSITDIVGIYIIKFLIFTEYSVNCAAISKILLLSVRVRYFGGFAVIKSGYDEKIPLTRAR